MHYREWRSIESDWFLVHGEGRASGGDSSREAGGRARGGQLPSTGRRGAQSPTPSPKPWEAPREATSFPPPRAGWPGEVAALRWGGRWGCGPRLGRTAACSRAGRAGSEELTEAGSPNHRVAEAAAASHWPRVASPTERDRSCSKGWAAPPGPRLTPKATSA